MQSVFHSIYDLLSQYVFGGDLSSYAFAEFWVEGVSMFFVTLLIMLPFLFIWAVIKRFL